MKLFLKVMFLGLVLLSLTSKINAEEIEKHFPEIHGKSLAGEEINLPQSLLGKPAFLIFGYSMNSNKDTTEWLKNIQKKFVTSSPDLDKKYTKNSQKKKKTFMSCAMCGSVESPPPAIKP